MAGIICDIWSEWQTYERIQKHAANSNSYRDFVNEDRTNQDALSDQNCEEYIAEFLFTNAGECLS